MKLHPFHLSPFNRNHHFRLLWALTIASWMGTLSAVGQDDHAHEEESEHGEVSEHGHESEHDENEEGHDDTLRLDQRDLHDFGIELATAGPGTIRQELRLPGEIRINENTMAHISPRFSGIVNSINRRLGEDVKAGESLASLESNITLRPFELVAPLQGTVVEYHITAGESLAAGDRAFTVADTSTVWADLRVYQRDLPKVEQGQQVRISAGHDFPSVEGSITYLGPVVDHETRTGLARIVLENPEGIFRPGLFVVGNVLLEEELHDVVLPLKAIHKLDARDVVYVQKADGDGFEAREVTIGHRDSVSAEIRSGVARDERYVAVGGFFLKADSQKESFGDGH